MKRISFVYCLLFIVYCFCGSDNCVAQTAPSKGKKMPVVKVKDLEGKDVDVSTITNDGKPIVFMFWATWCAPCLKELNNVAELYEEWQENTGVKIYAVSIRLLV